MTNPITFNKYIQPACLPNPMLQDTFPPINSPVYASGWV